MEFERTRHVQRAKFEEQMRQLEADHLAEERQLLNNEAASAPTTPPGRSVLGSTMSVPEMLRVEREQVAPIGQGREMANGAKSMPASRRTSGHGGSFAFEKLSVSVLSPGRREWTAEEEDVDAEGAQSKLDLVREGGL